MDLFTYILMVLLITLCFFIGLQAGRKRREKEYRLEEARHEAEDKKPEYYGMKPRDLCLYILKNMGCNIMSEGNGKDDDRILFAYQGESIIADVSNEFLCATFWDTSWMEADMEDIDEMSRLRRAINNVNVYNPLCIVFQADNDDKKFYVHTKLVQPMFSEVPDMVRFMHNSFWWFFETHKRLNEEIEKLKKAEEKAEA